MGGGFLMISPKIRMNLTQGFALVSGTLNLYTPYSYIGVAVGIFALLTISLQRSGTR